MPQNKNERGAVAILMACLLVVLVGISALALDLGSALVTKSELQNVSDAGSLAGARELAMIYKENTAANPTYSWKTTPLTESEKARIRAKVNTFTQANRAASASISVLEADTVYGKYDPSSGTVTASTTGVKAVQIKSRRDEQANGLLNTTAGRVLGINTLGVSATSAASLSPLGGVPAGYGEIPVGISSFWFDSKSCAGDNDIKFYPTGNLAGCAGWHTFTDYPASASRLGKILNGIQDGSFIAPATTAGSTYYNFTGGTVASRFSDMKALYDAKKDGSGNWRTTIPVYKDTGCANPNGATLIIGFAKAKIYGVKDSPDKEILAEVECGVVESGVGNGENDYGTLYGIPGMVR